MTDIIENERAVIGDNNPPSPMDEALAPYMDAIEEAENWLDGEAVQTEEQMKAVDDLIKQIRKCKSDLGKARDAATKPLHEAWKEEVAIWKPFEDKVKIRLDGLASLVNDFKRKLAAEKEAARSKAYEEQQAKEAAALEAARKANAGNLAEQEEAERLKREAMEAKKAASEANRDTVKGLRTVTKYKIDDHKALLHWIATNDKSALTGFVEEYARKHDKSAELAGVTVWEDREAY